MGWTLYGILHCSNSTLHGTFSFPRIAFTDWSGWDPRCRQVAHGSGRACQLTQSVSCLSETPRYGGWKRYLIAGLWKPSSLNPRSLSVSRRLLHDPFTLGPTQLQSFDQSKPGASVCVIEFLGEWSPAAMTWWCDYSNRLLLGCQRRTTV